ncbi:endonuclease/exonuclease/phosphatase family protein [Pseudodonghicola flavimaris]|uniref:Endonuclease/exonuclease/phosphatase family protein n=1 Tax=Pseudodonghicola flavimaris TaxID=3050036 RepID=A0ABT7F0H1_9RHOB|nr:endonuclease/exonuclease/phosphatase family protein [Pseudodonghicola flavimaris]MDK3018099.1 endonuclease/exonuclease/phosphatase family protein [Pseudodonghicola flavimaris]
MRLATYNVEWFANLFDQNDRLIMDDGPSGREGITRAQQTEALGKVFTALNADAIMVIEAPNTGRRQDTVQALEGFAQAFDLRQSRALMGFANETHQEIALLYDPQVVSARHDPQGAETGKKGSADAPRFDGVFRIDLDNDGNEDLVRFSKPPLELELTTRAGRSLRLIGAHLKSKAPHGEKSAEAALRTAISNRRKQLAQAIWLRQRIDALLAAGRSVILMGDLNDGPGLDDFETLFGRSSVEILLGEDMTDPHARDALRPHTRTLPTTARFFLGERGRYMHALLDYIMVSQDLMARRPAWRIWHPFEDLTCWAMPELRDALLAASDHFPVTLDIDI